MDCVRGVVVVVVVDSDCDCSSAVSAWPHVQINGGQFDDDSAEIFIVRRHPARAPRRAAVQPLFP
jgi:hypothetical protein